MLGHILRHRPNPRGKRLQKRRMGIYPCAELPEGRGVLCHGTSPGDYSPRAKGGAGSELIIRVSAYIDLAVLFPVLGTALAARLHPAGRRRALPSAIFPGDSSTT